MNENQKSKPQTEGTPEPNRGGAAQASAWKRLLSKKWVSPAAFMAAAAIIVTLLWLYQGTDRKEPAGGTSVTETGEQDKGEAGESAKGGTLEVAATGEVLQWPVVNRSEVEVTVPFYEQSATDQEKQQALVQAGTTFIPHTGLDFAKPDNSAFEVVAALSGKVTLAGSHPTNGYQIEITHDDGIVTRYESLSDIKVKEGDEVKQGTIIAKAGRSELEKDMGVHLHFEVRENGIPISPADALDGN